MSPAEATTGKRSNMSVLRRAVMGIRRTTREATRVSAKLQRLPRAIRRKVNIRERGRIFTGAPDDKFNLFRQNDELPVDAEGAAKARAHPPAASPRVTCRNTGKSCWLPRCGGAVGTQFNQSHRVFSLWCNRHIRNDKRFTTRKPQSAKAHIIITIFRVDVSAVGWRGTWSPSLNQAPPRGLWTSGLGSLRVLVVRQHIRIRFIPVVRPLPHIACHIPRAAWGSPPLQIHQRASCRCVCLRRNCTRPCQNYRPTDKCAHRSRGRLFPLCLCRQPPLFARIVARPAAKKRAWSYQLTPMMG